MLKATVRGHAAYVNAITFIPILTLQHGKEKAVQMAARARIELLFLPAIFTAL